LMADRTAHTLKMHSSIRWEIKPPMFLGLPRQSSDASTAAVLMLLLTVVHGLNHSASHPHEARITPAPSRHHPGARPTRTCTQLEQGAGHQGCWRGEGPARVGHPPRQTRGRATIEISPGTSRGTPAERPAKAGQDGERPTTTPPGQRKSNPLVKPMRSPAAAVKSAPPVRQSQVFFRWKLALARRNRAKSAGVSVIAPPGVEATFENR